MTSLPAHAVQGALDILLQHIHMPDVVGGDRTSLGSREIEQMEKKCRSLQAVLDVFTNAVLQRITAFHKERNQFVPIHRLPLELLIAIFELTKSSRPYRCYDSIHPLLQVSSHWRTVIQSSPSFWSTISTAYNPQFLKIVLERSKNVPLDIHCEGLESERRRSFETALSLASRWRSITIPADLLAESSEWYLMTKELPLLKKFAATSPYKPFREVPTVVLDSAPRLSHLHVTPYNFPLGSGVFSKLIDISITAVMDNKVLSCAQWHTFLSSAPQIKKIRAEGASVSQPHEEPSIFNVSMPKLEAFNLYEVPSLMIGTLLCSVTVPQNSYPEVVVLPFTNDGYGFIDIFPTPAPAGSLLSRIREMSWIKGQDVDWDEPTVTAGRVEGEKLFWLFLDNDPRPRGDLFRSLIPSDGLPNLQHITLKGDPFFEDKYFSSCISSCKGLERLVLVNIGWKFHGASDGSFDGLARLCTDLLPQATEWGEPYWPCPSLKHVDIATCSSADFTSVLRLLKARNRLTSGDVESPSSGLPVTLDELKLQIRGGDGMSSFPTTYPDMTAELEAVAKSHNTKLSLLPIIPEAEEGGQGIVARGLEYPEDVGFGDSDESECGSGSWPWD